MNMTPGSESVLACLAISGAALMLQGGTSPHPSVRESTVRVMVDRPGGPATGLRREDFELRVDGRIRPIEAFATDGGPLSVVLLLDVSDSVGFGRTGFSRAADRSFVRRLRPRDRGSIGAIARQTRVGAWAAGDSPELREQARSALRTPDDLRSGPSPIWDAVDAALDALESEVGRHRAIVIVSDGRATGNVHGLTEVAERAMREGVSISAIAIMPPPLRPKVIPQTPSTVARIRPDALLGLLADDTGGTKSECDAGCAGPLARSIDSLFASYALTFLSDDDGRLHDVDVRVTPPGHAARVGRRYLAR
jgi:von Willebrand factor type A domain